MQGRKCSLNGLYHHQLDPRHLGADNKAQNKKGTEQKGREITMLRHRYIQDRNFFR